VAGRYSPCVSVTDHDLAVAAAEAGASVVRAKFGSSQTRYAKAPGDFATEADLAAERAILEVLRTARPGDAVLGEETGHTGITRDDRTWLVDPLCGTLNYAAHTTMVAVNVALRAGSAITAAAAADPFTGEVFWAGRQQAYLRRGGADDKLTPSADTRLVDINLDPLPNSPALQATELLTDTQFNQQFRPRVISTTLAVAWVAAPPTSRLATCATACTSPPGSPSAKPQDASSPASTDSRCTPAQADSSLQPTKPPTRPS
jgi:myo-inositol-1(or 4)-monophosphatase